MEPSLPWLVMSRRNPVFCKVFGTDAADPEADADVKGIADVAAWMVEGSLYWKALTEKGEALTEAVKELLIPADDDQVKVDAEKEAIRAIVEKLPYTHLSLEGWDGNATDEKFNSPVWETLYKPCLACGTCTFVCPTCQCYDIKGLRHRTRCKALPLLGFLYVFRFHNDGSRKQPYQPDAEIPSEIYA